MELTGVATNMATIEPNGTETPKRRTMSAEARAHISEGIRQRKRLPVVEQPPVPMAAEAEEMLRLTAELAGLGERERQLKARIGELLAKLNAHVTRVTKTED